MRNTVLIIIIVIIIITIPTIVKVIIIKNLFRFHRFTMVLMPKRQKKS